jgi:hypothetical protein
MIKNNEISKINNINLIFKKDVLPPLLTNENQKEINYENQRYNQNSPLNYYRNLMTFRNNKEIKEILKKGKLTP